MVKTKEKSMTVNAFLNGLRNVINLIFPLITFPYISRVLSINGVGKCTFSMNYVSYFILISGLGISTYSVREGAKYRDNYTKFSDFASNMFTINMWSTFFSYILLFSSLLIFNKLNMYFYCILIFSVQILFTTLGTEWIYTIYEDYAYITIRSILFKIISVILMFTFVRNSNDYLLYAFIIVFASVGSNILNFIHARSICKIQLIGKIEWRQHLKPILIIFASSVAVSIYVSSDITILGFMESDKAVGLYNVPVRIYTIIKTLISSILIVTVPRLSMLYGKKQIESYNYVLKNLLNTLTILIFPASVGMMLMSEDIILLLAGDKYVNAKTALFLISLGVIFCIYNWVFSDCVLIPAKRERYLLRNTIISAAFNIILNILLIPFLSYNACSISTVFSELLAMLLNFESGKDIVKDIVYSKEIVFNFFTVIIGSIILIPVCLIIKKIALGLVAELLFSIIISVIIYLSTLIILKNKVAIAFLQQYFKFK